MSYFKTIFLDKKAAKIPVVPFLFVFYLLHALIMIRRHKTIALRSPDNCTIGLNGVKK